MTTNWTNAAGGDWNTASNWSPHTVPGKSNIAVLGGTDAYTVTYSATSGSVRAIHISDSQTELLLEPDASLSLSHGISGSGATPPVVDVDDAVLQLTKGENVRHVTIDLTDGGQIDLTNPASIKDHPQVTFGADTVIEEGPTTDADGLGGRLGGFGNVIEDGTIDAGTSGSQFAITVHNFINDGTINAAGGSLFLQTHELINNGTIDIANDDSAQILFNGIGHDALSANNGTISVSNGATAHILFQHAAAGASSVINVENGGTVYLQYTNQTTDLPGVINLESGGKLYLQLQEDLKPSTIDNTGGTLVITGDYFNTGRTLNFDRIASLGDWAFDGSIMGGTVRGLSGHVIDSLDLNGVTTYYGSIDLASDAELQISGGLMMTSVSTGNGTIVANSDNEIDAIGTETIANAIIDLGASSELVSNSTTPGRATTLTLASSIVIDQTGANATIASGILSGQNLVNDGTIKALVNGGTLTIEGTVVNDGIVNVGNGDTLSLDAQLSGTGKINLIGNATVTVGDDAVSGNSFNFENRSGGLLQIITPSTFDGMIANFVAGDTIGVDGATSAAITGRAAVTLYDDATAVGTLNFNKSLAGQTLDVASTSNGIDISLLAQSSAGFVSGGGDDTITLSTSYEPTTTLVSTHG